jgi:hypothetical protein
MQRRQQYEVDSLRRVQAFLDTHADLVGPLKATEAGKQLEAAVVQVTAHALDQGTAERVLAGAGSQVRQQVGDLKANHMTPVAKFSRANLRGVPDFKALAHVPHQLGGRRLVGAARAMATAALPYSDALAAAQFPTDSVKELGAAAEALHVTLDARTAALSQRVIATAGVRQELALGREAVAMLDPVVIKRLAGRTDLLAGWRSAKRVTLMPQSVVVAVPPMSPLAGTTPAPAASRIVASIGAAPVAQEVKAA